MKARELVEFFMNMDPNTDVKIASAADGKPVVESISKLSHMFNGALIQTESFESELTRRAAKAATPLKALQ